MSVTPTTWNPADKSANFVVYGSDLIAQGFYNGQWGGVRSIFGASSGKFYWEVLTSQLTNHAASEHLIGISKAAALYACGEDANGWAYHGADAQANSGYKYNSNSLQAYGAQYGHAALTMHALDMDNGKVWWGLNGTWAASGDPAAGTNPAYTGLTGTIYAHYSAYWGENEGWANFGATAFAYTVPTGFQAGFGSILLPQTRRSCPIWL